MSAIGVRARGRRVLRDGAAGDVALTAGLAVFMVVGTYFASHGQPARRDLDAWGVVLLLAAAAPLAVRRRHPVAALEAAFGATLVYMALGYPSGPVWLPLVVAYVTAVLRGHRVAALVTAAAGLATFPWLDTWFRARPAPSWVGIAALAAWLLVLFGAAEAVRIRRERAAEAVRIAREETLRRTSEERLRIARELHDALGHHLSLINVQAGVALHVHEGLPDQVRSSLTAIKDASKEGLAELRSVLDILRREGERAPRTPTSTLARLEDLVGQASVAGLDVQIQTEGDPRPLPFGVDVAAYRIVQEALTNVTRHAGAGTATVRVTYAERDLTVQVDDDGHGGRAPSADGAGKGVRGMRERVAALGGELEVGPRPAGGFRVRARLPLEGAA
jgi:signal transduction histidine kinase